MNESSVIFWHYTQEKEFVKYFDRLRSIGMTFKEIRKILPQLENYYYEMVINADEWINEPSLVNLYEKWINYRYEYEIRTNEK